ncbi:MAG: sigma-70 family RNA polymerase sigma factor [Cyanobium sp.]
MNTCTARRPFPLGTPRRKSSPSAKALKRRNALVEAHQHLVPPVACHYARRCPEPKDDLIQVGLLGLIRAAELFKPSAQTPFSAFARPHIRGAILHYLRDAAAPVRLPRRQEELRIRLQRVEDVLSSTIPEPVRPEVDNCPRLQVTEQQRQLLLRHRRLCRPMPLTPELLDQLSTAATEPQEDSQASQARVDQLLLGLDPRTQQVIRWVVLQDWSYRRTAAALNVSAMTVQRCLHSGLEDLRKRLNTTHRPRSTSSGGLSGPAPSAARGWPSRHSPPPAGAPTHRAKT